MPKPITLEPHLATEELYRRYRACHQAREKVRWHALYLISSGQQANATALRVGRPSGWITELARRYNARGQEAVADQRGETPPGAKPCLDAEAATALAAALRDAAPDGGLWTAPKVAAWIAARTGQQVDETTAWRWMRRLGFTLQVPCPRHRRRASEEEQAEFKKNSAPLWSNSSSSTGVRRLRCGAKTKHASVSSR